MLSNAQLVREPSPPCLNESRLPQQPIAIVLDVLRTRELPPSDLCIRETLVEPGLVHGAGNITANYRTSRIPPVAVLFTLADVFRASMSSSPVTGVLLCALADS